MMKKPITFLIIFLIFLFGFSQTTDENTEMKCPDTIPESETTSIETIAAHINKHHKTEKEKITAIYCWLGHNLAYDIAKAAALPSSTTEFYDKGKNIRNTLAERKGVCQDYAELMETLCEKCGIKVFPVYGIARDQERIGEAHAWIAARIEDKWRIYDPTWGAGHINDGVFYQHFDFKFYDIPPKNAIQSHLPFDPIWQLLSYPVSVESFYHNDFQEELSQRYFNFSDTIALFLKKDSVQQVYDMMRRIETRGVYNQATVDYLTYLNTIIENEKVHYFNKGTLAFNEAVAALNDYSQHFNRQFTPEKSRETIEKMLITAEAEIKTAVQCFQSIKNPPAEMHQNILQLNSKINTMLQQLVEHKKFVEKYFNTTPALRKTLFYQR